MNAAKYIRYILTIATALLFFSACKDDKSESQPTDFILRVDESVSIKLPNSTSYTITTITPRFLMNCREKYSQ